MWHPLDKVYVQYIHCGNNFHWRRRYTTPFLKLNLLTYFFFVLFVNLHWPSPWIAGVSVVYITHTLVIPAGRVQGAEQGPMMRAIAFFFQGHRVIRGLNLLLMLGLAPFVLHVQSIRQSVHQSINQSISRSVSRSVNQSSSKSVCQSLICFHMSSMSVICFHMSFMS